MATATTTPIEDRLNAAIDAYNDAEEQAAQANGAEAQRVADTTAAQAYDEMQRAHAAWTRTDAGQKFEDDLRASRAAGDPGRMASRQVLSDGKTFDDLASSAGVVNPTAGMTLGDAFAASDAYQELRAQHLKADGTLADGIGKSRSIDFAVSFTSLINGQARFAFRDGEGPKNTLVTGNSDTSGGAFVTPYRVPGTADLAPLRRPVLFDLCTRIPLDTDLMEFEQITSKTNNAAFVPEATSSADIDGTTVTAAIGGRKPESAMAFAVGQVPVETIAHFIPITRRAAADAPRLVTLLNTFLFAGLNVKAEDSALNGNGTSPNLKGLINSSIPWNILTFDISVNSSPTRLDAIALAAGSIVNAGKGEWYPNAVLINPLDWFSTNFLLAKDGQSNYFGPGPWAALGNQAPWGIQPIITTAVAQGTQVLGDFSQALFGDRQQNSLYFSDSNRDWFERNLLAALAEARMAFAVRVPSVFVQIVP